MLCTRKQFLGLRADFALDTFLVAASTSMLYIFKIAALFVIGWRYYDTTF